MDVKPTIVALQELIDIHNTMILISKEKTEIIKAGDAEELQRLLVKERKYIQLLKHKEEAREKAVESWFVNSDNHSENRTVTKMLALINSETAKRELEEHINILMELLIVLKQQEQLNKGLIKQSLQFVQLSLDIMNPAISNKNYGTKNTSIERRSVFDSKA